MTSNRSEATARDALEQIAIFPLDSLVLLPRVRVPLHIFEPRYRQMTRDALAGSKRIGMVVVMPADVGSMLGNPPVFPVGCAGAISESEELADGRFRVLLEGIHRFRIHRELEPEGDRLYRCAQVERLSDAYPASDRTEVRELREEVIALLREWLRQLASDGSPASEETSFDGIDDETLVNALAQSLDLLAVEKQGLIEADTIVDRYRRLAGLMRFRLAELGGPGGANPAGIQ